MRTAKSLPDFGGMESSNPGRSIGEPQEASRELDSPELQAEPRVRDEESAGSVRQPRPLRPAPLATPQLYEALDELERELGQDAEEVQGKTEFILSAARGLVLVVSSSLVGAVLRGGSLVALALSSLPLWRRFDPLAVLALTDTERRRQAEKLRSEEREEARKARGLSRLLDEDDPEVPA